MRLLVRSLVNYPQTIDSIPIGPYETVTVNLDEPTEGLQTAVYQRKVQVDQIDDGPNYLEI